MNVVNTIEKITDNTNKELLWNLLYENNIFKNIPNNNFDDIKKIFDSTLNEYHNYKITSNNEAISINKKIISELLSKINNFKSSPLTTIFDKDNFKMNKNNELNKSLENHVRSMNNILNPVKPTEIDFKDNADEDKPMNSNDMNNLLKQMQKDREPDSKIFEKNIMSNNIKFEMDDNNDVPKLKINDIEELLKETNDIIELKTDNTNDNIENPDNKDSINQDSINKDSANQDILLDREKLYKNSFIANEYLSENKMNTNIKLDSIIKLLKELQSDNNEIKNKLENIINK
tara:strand:+ start:621 stop:1487 length:867 start_codon:yes stop_codon:yes gene_type:complete